MKCDNSVNFFDENNSNIAEVLIKCFESIKNQGRYKSYSNQKYKISKIKNTFKISTEPESKSLEEIVFMNGTVNNVSICGRGGSGKTFQLIHLAEYILSPDNKKDNVEPLYIPLNQFNTIPDGYENLIEKKIYDLLNEYNIDTKKFLSCEGNYFGKTPLLLLDGLNEITDSNSRQEIISDITEIKTNHKNVRIVISSRLDHSFSFIQGDTSSPFIKAEVNNLNDDQINGYLRDNNINLNILDLTHEKRELLKTPQGLVMYAELYSNSPDFTVDSLGSLLKVYISHIGQIDDIDDYNNLSEIAYTMVQNGVFRIRRDDLNGKIIFSDKEKVSSILTSIGKSYEFTHQNFRDYFAAYWLCIKIQDIADGSNYKDMINDIRNVFKNGNIFNDEILQLTSDLIDVTIVQSVITYIQQHDIGECDFSFAISNLIRIAALKTQEHDISFLDLSGLDLRKVNLNGYLLYHKDRKVEFENTKISNSTFTHPGLQGGSAAISYYKNYRSEYLAAFSATNVLIYDIQENIWECYRNMPNMIWTHCYCNLLIDNSLYIVYGGRQLKLQCYIPEKNKSYSLLESELLSENGKNNIICSIVSLNENDLIYFVSTGSIYYLNHDALPYNNNGVTPILIFKIENFIENMPRHKCRLTKSNEYIYASAANVIYRCNISNLILAIANNDFNNLFEIYKEYADELIYDICFTDNKLYINLGRKVTCIDILHDNFELAPVGVNKLDDDFKIFRKFSVEKKGVVVCGIDSKNFNKCVNMYRFHIDKRKIVMQPIHGMQKLSINSSVCYNFMGRLRIASVSDDRSVQIIAPENEDIDIIMHEGAYYGIHDIAIVSEIEIVSAQYDGSISYWKKENDSWICQKVFPIHTDWVWTVKYYSPYIISCSYDGTVKITNINSNKTEVVLSIDFYDTAGQFFDFDVLLDKNENPYKIVAITSNYVYIKEINCTKQYVKRFENDFAARAVQFLSNGKVIIAVNNNNICKMIEWDGLSNFVDLFDAPLTCGFIRRFSFNSIAEHEILVLAGNTHEINVNDWREYYAFYINENGQWKYIEHEDEFYIQNSDEIDADSVSGTSVNDFSILNILSDDGVHNSILISVTKNNIFAYRIKFDKESKKIGMARFAIVSIDSQPMCIKYIGNKFFIGFLNGIIREYVLTWKDIDDCKEILLFPNANHMISVIDQIITHPKLISNGDVDLTNVTYDEDTNSDEFKNDFKGYFNFEV